MYTIHLRGGIHSGIFFWFFGDLMDVDCGTENSWCVLRVGGFELVVTVKPNFQCIYETSLGPIIYIYKNS